MQDWNLHSGSSVQACILSLELSRCGGGEKKERRQLIKNIVRNDKKNNTIMMCLSRLDFYQVLNLHPPHVQGSLLAKYTSGIYSE